MMHAVDLTPATNAFLDNVAYILANAEHRRGARTKFSAQEDFIWDNGDGRRDILTAHVIAQASTLMGCYVLNVFFTGDSADGFRRTHKSTISAAIIAVLAENNWELAQLRKDLKPEIVESRDGFFLTLTRSLDTTDASAE